MARGLPLQIKSPSFFWFHRPASVSVANDKKLGKNIENVNLLNNETILLGDIDIDFRCSLKFRNNAAKSEYVTTCNGNYLTIVKNLPRSYLE